MNDDFGDNSDGLESGLLNPIYFINYLNAHLDKQEGKIYAEKVRADNFDSKGEFFECYHLVKHFIDTGSCFPKVRLGVNAVNYDRIGRINIDIKCNFEGRQGIVCEHLGVFLNSHLRLADGRVSPKGVIELFSSHSVNDSGEEIVKRLDFVYWPWPGIFKVRDKKEVLKSFFPDEWFSELEVERENFNFINH